MYKKTLRPAIAMIELIFALVIMGIVLMTAPMLISTAAKSGYVAIQQEAINEAASQVNMIMGYHWDENTTDETYLDPILNVIAGNGDLNVSGTTGRRRGTPLESYRSFIRSDGTDDLNASASLGSDPTGEIKDDMDDFIGDTDLTLNGVGEAGNVETTTININTTFSYINDNPTGSSYQPVGGTLNFDLNFATATGTTNIKGITIKLTSNSSAEELNTKEIKLRAFSCNIGGYKLEEKSF